MNRPERSIARISVVLPVLNEQAILASLIGEINHVLAETGCHWNIIVVNDGSTDASGSILDEMARIDPRIHVLHLARNFGHQAAVHAGICDADGDAVVVMDSDGQDSPRAIREMIECWFAGDDVVYAVRFGRKESAIKRMMFRSFYQILAAVSSVSIPRDAGNFGLLDRCVVNQIRNLPENDRYFPGLRSWVGFRQRALAVERMARHDDKPRVSFRGLCSLAKTALFSFSRVPLLAFYLLALASGVVSVGCISYAVFHKLFTGLAIPGWASITSVLAFFGAVQSLGIAILGEYIARIYDQVRGRPTYIVARRENNSQVARNSKQLESLTTTLESSLLQQLESLRAEGIVSSEVNSSKQPADATNSQPQAGAGVSA